MIDTSRMTLYQKRKVAKAFAEELINFGQDWLDQIDDTSAIAAEYIKYRLQGDLDQFPRLIREDMARRLAQEGVKV